MGLAIGSVVYLKSGGPALTIAETTTDSIIAVDWFAGEELRREAFHVDELTIANPHLTGAATSCCNDQYTNSTNAAQSALNAYYQHNKFGTLD